MFHFLKRIFNKQKHDEHASSEPQHIAFSNLEQWFNAMHQARQAHVNERMTATGTTVCQLADTVREKIDILVAAKLMNPNIPERAKDIMNGNREEYNRRVLQYLETLTLPETPDALTAFFAQHHKDAHAFTQSIMRPFQILQEFFAHESKEVTALLAQIEQELLALETLHDSTRLAGYDALHTNIQALIAKHHQLRGLEHEHADLELQRTDAKQAFRTLQTEEEKWLNHPERSLALKRVAEAQQRAKQHEQHLRELFAGAEPAIRKFHRMATRNVKLVESYVRDPVATLVEDLHLQILDILADINRLLDFDRLSLGDKHRNVVTALNTLTKDTLGAWLRDYGNLTKTVKDTRQATEDSEASRMLARVQRLKEETQRNLQLLEQRLARVRKDYAKIDLPALMTSLEQRVKDVTGTMVRITD